MIHHLNETPRNPDRVVLLGSRGFIAVALRKELETRGIAVLAVGSADLDLAAPDAADTLASRLKPTDAVVMLAALTPDRGRGIATLMTNLAMMQNVCAALDKAGCSHLVYFSSDAVYDPALARVTEGTPASPPDLYGAMHFAREIMASSLPRIRLTILRVTMVYGVDDPHNSYGPNRFRRTAQTEGRITLFGRGEETRDHVHVGDVARLAAECLSHGSAGTLNVATGISTSFRKVAECVAQQCSGHIEIVETPRAKPVTHRHYDVTALIRAFPAFRFVGLEQGVAAVHRHEARGFDV